jgi:hypothetical protein
MRLPYLQLSDDVWGHAKVLAALLGCDRHRAISLLVDLWRWALEQGEGMPSGEVRGRFAAARLAGAVEWSGDAAALADALCEAGLTDKLEDGLRIRGLGRYEAAFRRQEADRQRKAEARAQLVRRKSGGSPQDVQRKFDGSPRGVRAIDVDVDVDVEGNSIKTSSGSEDPPPSASDWFLHLWNANAPAACPRLAKMSDKRRKGLAQRLKEHSRQQVEDAVRRLAASPFAQGQNDRGWKADADWLLLKPDTVTRILEGKYDGRQQMRTHAGIPVQTHAAGAPCENACGQAGVREVFGPWLCEACATESEAYWSRQDAQ